MTMYLYIPADSSELLLGYAQGCTIRCSCSMYHWWLYASAPILHACFCVYPLLPAVSHCFKGNLCAPFFEVWCVYSSLIEGVSVIRVRVCKGNFTNPIMKGSNNRKGVTLLSGE